MKLNEVLYDDKDRLLELTIFMSLNPHQLNEASGDWRGKYKKAVQSAKPKVKKDEVQIKASQLPKAELELERDWWAIGEDMNRALDTYEYESKERVLIFVFEHFQMSLKDIQNQV